MKAKLAAMAAADPARERFGAASHRYRLNAPVAAAEIGVFERLHDIRLPTAYRTFLTSLGSGGAGPYYGMIDWAEVAAPGGQPYTPGFLATPFPHTGFWNPNTDAANLVPDEEYWHDRWITGSVAIVHFGCGAYVRLAVCGRSAGQVWFDDRVSDGGLRPGPDFRDWYLSWLDETPEFSSAFGFGAADT